MRLKIARENGVPLINRSSIVIIFLSHFRSPRAQNQGEEISTVHIINPRMLKWRPQRIACVRLIKRCM